MTARRPRSAVSAPDPDIEADVPQPEPPSSPEGRAPRSGPGGASACGLDPFAAFTEWSGPADEADYADL